MLTDSGGFQAFSLGRARASKAKDALVAPSEEGFTFRSHLDGSKHHLSPEEAVRVQAAIGADIQMQLDVCPPGESERAVVEAAVEQDHPLGEARARRRAPAGASAVRDRPGGVLRRSASRPRRGARRARREWWVRRPRARRLLRGRADRTDVRSVDRRRTRPRSLTAPLLDGGGDAARSPPRDRLRHGHVRLRPAYAQRAKRPGPHAEREARRQAGPVPSRHAPDRPGVRVPDVPRGATRGPTCGTSTWRAKSSR